MGVGGGAGDLQPRFFFCDVLLVVACLWLASSYYGERGVVMCILWLVGYGLGLIKITPHATYTGKTRKGLGMLARGFLSLSLPLSLYHIGHYEVLGVDRDGSTEDIARHFQDIALPLHPDKTRPLWRGRHSLEPNELGMSYHTPLSVSCMINLGIVL